MGDRLDDARRGAVWVPHPADTRDWCASRRMAALRNDGTEADRLLRRAIRRARRRNAHFGSNGRARWLGRRTLRSCTTHVRGPGRSSGRPRRTDALRSIIGAGQWRLVHVHSNAHPDEGLSASVSPPGAIRGHGESCSCWKVSRGQRCAALERVRLDHTRFAPLPTPTSSTPSAGCEQLGAVLGKNRARVRVLAVGAALFHDREAELVRR